MQSPDIEVTHSMKVVALVCSRAGACDPRAKGQDIGLFQVRREEVKSCANDWEPGSGESGFRPSPLGM